MNDTLAAFARQQLKDGLARCTGRQQATFKLMYAKPTDPFDRTPEIVGLIKKAKIDDVVDGMDEEKLSWAMDQVTATLAKERQDNARGSVTQSK